jgi:hypothetical protein
LIQYTGLNLKVGQSLTWIDFELNYPWHPTRIWDGADDRSNPQSSAFTPANVDVDFKNYAQ